MITFHHIHSFDHDAKERINNLTAAINGLTVRLSAIPALSDAINDLADKIDQISRPDTIIVVAGQSIHISLPQGDDMSYTVPRDHVDVAFSLDPISVADAEGDIAFTESFDSDNVDVVSIDAAAQTLHFGTFGGATLTRTVEVNGQTFIVASAVFNVTPGTVVVTGGAINIPDLTADPE